MIDRRTVSEGYLLLKSLELLLGHNIMDEESGEEHDPCSFIWIEGDSLAPPCQSDHDVVSKIVKIARLTRDDFLFDLGCGDGRICIEAAKRFGSRAHGVEIEEFLVKRFRELIVANNLQQLISVSHGDLLEEDLSQATVIVTYLLPDAMDQLTSKFIKLLSQSDKDVRIICNTWGIRGLTPAERHDVGPYKNVPLFVYKSTAELPRPQTTNSRSTRLSETQDN